ncbi:MAG: hypothetical protein ACR2NP_19885 [Pirellulaceae bacterium]
MTNEQTDQQQQQTRKGSSARLIILVLFLIVVGAGCIFEFAYARPQFQSAWEKIKSVDASSKSGEKTSEDIQSLMGREPAAIDETLHDECVVHTYRWPSGLLFKSHYIHVVFTKLKPGLVEKKPDLKGKLFYLSAAADMPLDVEENFPKEKETIVMNMNPPNLNIGGGAGARPPTPPRNNDGDDDEEAGGDKESSEEESSTEETGEQQEPATGETSDEDAADEKSDGDKSDDDQNADDEGDQ